MSSGKLTETIWKIPSKIVSTCNKCMLTSLKSMGFDNLLSKMKEQVTHLFKNALILYLLESIYFLTLISTGENSLFPSYSLCQPERNVMNIAYGQRSNKRITDSLSIRTHQLQRSCYFSLVLKDRTHTLPNHFYVVPYTQMLPRVFPS